MARWPTATCASVRCSNVAPTGGRVRGEPPAFRRLQSMAPLNPESGKSGRVGNGDTPGQKSLEQNQEARGSPHLSRAIGGRTGRAAADFPRLDSVRRFRCGNFGTGFPCPSSRLSNRPASHPSHPLPALPQLRSPAGRTRPEHRSFSFPGQRLGQRPGSRPPPGESALPDGPRGADAARRTDGALPFGDGHPP